MKIRLETLCGCSKEVSPAELGIYDTYLHPTIRVSFIPAVLIPDDKNLTAPLEFSYREFELCERMYIAHSHIISDSMKNLEARYEEVLIYREVYKAPELPKVKPKIQIEKQPEGRMICLKGPC
jgi:hypothetical protein